MPGGPHLGSGRHRGHAGPTLSPGARVADVLLALSPWGWESTVLGTEPTQGPAWASPQPTPRSGPRGRVPTLLATRPPAFVLTAGRSACRRPENAQHHACASPTPSSCRAGWRPGLRKGAPCPSGRGLASPLPFLHFLSPEQGDRGSRAYFCPLLEVL